jgi:hypothetical protein
MLEIYFILGKDKETFEKDDRSFLDSSILRSRWEASGYSAGTATFKAGGSTSYSE